MGNQAVGLTGVQQRVYDFCVRTIQEDGRAPTYCQMMRALGMSSRSQAWKAVTALVERGFLIRYPRRANALFLPEDRRCPLCGHAEDRGS